MPNIIYAFNVCPTLILGITVAIFLSIYRGSHINFLNKEIIEIAHPSGIFMSNALYFTSIFVKGIFIGMIPLASLFIYACVVNTSLAPSADLIQNLANKEYWLTTNFDHTMLFFSGVSTVIISGMGVYLGTVLYHYGLDKIFSEKSYSIKGSHLEAYVESSPEFIRKIFYISFGALGLIILLSAFFEVLGG